MVSKKLENFIDAFVWETQGRINAETDNYCYDELRQNSFNFRNFSIDFLANDIDLIQS